MPHVAAPPTTTQTSATPPMVGLSTFAEGPAQLLPLRPGASARLQGLRSRPELNGEIVQLQAYNDIKERRSVATVFGTLLNVRISNLEPCDQVHVEKRPTLSTGANLQEDLASIRAPAVGTGEKPSGDVTATNAAAHAGNVAGAEDVSCEMHWNAIAEDVEGKTAPLELAVGASAEKAAGDAVADEMFVDAVGEKALEK